MQTRGFGNSDTTDSVLIALVALKGAVVIGRCLECEETENGLVARPASWLEHAPLYVRVLGPKVIAAIEI